MAYRIGICDDEQNIVLILTGYIEHYFQLQGEDVEIHTWNSGEELISDKVFGKYAPVTKHSNFSRIKAGDHIRIGNEHSVMVLQKNGNTLTVVEGNYNATVHWGRKITKKELQESGFYVETRY